MPPQAKQVPTPTGTITSADVLIDVQGVADVKNVTVNGIAQKLKKGHKHGHHGHHGMRDHDSDDD